MIRADAHSDDYRVELVFDATRWFEQATDGEIEALADAGWGGCEAADGVAEHFEQTSTRELFDYTAISGEGFECHVDETDAWTWLARVRPSLAAWLDMDTGCAVCGTPLSSRAEGPSPAFYHGGEVLCATHHDAEHEDDGDGFVLGGPR